MKVYITPEASMTYLSNEDIIATSTLSNIAEDVGVLIDCQDWI